MIAAFRKAKSKSPLGRVIATGTFIYFVVCANTVQAAEFFDCTIDNYKNLNGYDEKVAVSWVPRRQAHEFDGRAMKIVEPSTGWVSSSIKKTTNKLSWKYDHYVQPNGPEMTFAYDYFFKNDKLAVQVRIKGYNDLKTMWGICYRQQVSNEAGANNTVTQSSGSIAPQKEIEGQVSKLDEAKALCAEIGYTKGTEKFADCVMKLIDS